MGIEVSTYISGLTPTWPPSGDPKNQGDDHLRLIKSVLQSTFPNASKAFYFPSSMVVSGPTGTTLTAANDKSVVYYTTAGGDAAVTLPSGLALGDAGWSVEVVKYSSDTNGVMVAPSSGSIITQFGAAASVRVGAVCLPVRFVWSGSTWFSFRQGPIIGSTISFDGSTVPAGFLVLDGSTYNSTTFAELFLALGTATLRDKRGRVEAGVDSGGLRLTSGANGFATAAVNGAVGGLESNTLDATRIPAVAFSGTTGVDSPDHTHGFTAVLGSTGPLGLQGGGTYPSAYIAGVQTSTNTGGASARHTHTFSGNISGGGLGHANVQPTIVTNKIVRAA